MNYPRVMVAVMVEWVVMTIFFIVGKERLTKVALARWKISKSITILRKCFPDLFCFIIKFILQ